MQGKGKQFSDTQNKKLDEILVHDTVVKQGALPTELILHVCVYQHTGLEYATHCKTGMLFEPIHTGLSTSNVLRNWKPLSGEFTSFGNFVFIRLYPSLPQYNFPEGGSSETRV